jgi:hypothetical protein
MSIRCHLVRTAIEMIEAKLTLLCGETVSALAIEGQVGVRALQPAFSVKSSCLPWDIFASSGAAAPELADCRPTRKSITANSQIVGTSATAFQRLLPGAL